MGVSNEQGAVYRFSRAANLNGAYSTLWASDSFMTEEAGCRHGDTLLATSTYLIVGSPFCHNEIDGQEQRIAGRVSIFSQSSPK